MSHVTASTHDAHGHNGHGHHDPHLAHHFDTMEQQYDSGKLGMWIFLGTELLMFGGLFCAYSVYRANHPEVFIYSHTFLNTTLGAINTAILLASSLTMAWAVRAAQLSWNKGVVALCLATLLGGAGFMIIKAIEYNAKFEHHLAPGIFNQYNTGYAGNEEYPGQNNSAGTKIYNEELAAKSPADVAPSGIAATPAEPYSYLDPNAGSGDAAKIVPRLSINTELVAAQSLATSEHAVSAAEGEGEGHGEAKEEGPHGAMPFVDIQSAVSRQRINTFFGIYYCMTGLHGLHVLVGMALIVWIAYRAGTGFQKAWILPLIPMFLGAYLLFIYAIAHNTGAHVLSDAVGFNVNPVFQTIGGSLLGIGVLWMLVRVMKTAGKPVTDHGEFTATYFAPVDLVGLYWHLVDLIWIFLFPLLYLIHGHVGS